MTRFLGGTTPATTTTVMDQTYGYSPVTRLYDSAELSVPGLNNRNVVGSFKTLTGFMLPYALQYYRLFYIHEIDSKVAKGQWTLANWKADMSVLIEKEIPQLSICLTADVFVNPKKNPNDYIIPGSGITHYGIDFDGISSATGYHDYTHAFNNCNAWAARNGFTIGVPEFGANRAANDPTDTKRAAWCDTWVNNFISAGYEYVCWWEYSGQSGSEMTSPNGTDAVKRLISRSGALVG